MFRRIFFAIALWGLLGLNVEAAQRPKRRFVLEFYSYNCYKFGETFKLLECQFTKVAINRYAFAIQAMTSRDLGKKSEFRTLLEFQTQTQRKAFRLIDLKVNACEFFSNGLMSQLLKTVIEEAYKTSNATLGCPLLKANVLYVTQNQTIDGEVLPPYLPYGNATYSTEIYDNKKLVARLIAIGSIIGN